MAVSWNTIRSLLVIVTPFLFVRAFTYYRAVTARSRSRTRPAVRAVPPGTSRALSVLFVVAAAFFLLTFPLFAPENVFVVTDSRLQTPVDVLFRRLASVRPSGSLSPADEALRLRFVSDESRLLYLQFGPDVLARCPFCGPDDPRSHFYYAAPAQALPHLLNLLALAAVTATREGSQWRTLVTIAVVAVGLVDLYVVNSYNPQSNARAVRRQDLDPFFWNMRVYRYLALAGLDALVGWLVYLSSTNRAFVRLPTPAERVSSVTRALQAAKAKLNAVGIVKNTASRDDALRSRSQAYWSHEVRLMADVMEEREVVNGIKDALENRINIQAVSRNADDYSNGLLTSLPQSTNNNEVNKQASK